MLASEWTVTNLKHSEAHGRLLLLLKCCFTSTETEGLLGTGAQDGSLDFHTAPELCMSGGVYIPCLGLCACVTSFECQLSPLCVDSARALWASFCRFVFTVFLVRGAAPSLFHYFPKALKQMNSLRKKTIDQAWIFMCSFVIRWLQMSS